MRYAQTVQQLRYISRYRKLAKIGSETRETRAVCRERDRAQDTHGSPEGNLYRAAIALIGEHPARAFVFTSLRQADPQRVLAQFDGPLGALELCTALRAVGGDAWMITDETSVDMIRPTAEMMLPREHVLSAPNDTVDYYAFFNAMETLGVQEHVNTLISSQPVRGKGKELPYEPVMLSQTESEHHGKLAAKLHSIGILNGACTGRHHDTDHADECIVAGTTNWGAHALVCAIHALGFEQVAPLLDVDWHRAMLRSMFAFAQLDIADEDARAEEEDYYRRIGQLSAMA